MKKVLLALTLVSSIGAANAQQRYLDEIFDEVTVTEGVSYGQNYQFLTGTPFISPLSMDVYEPANDTYDARAVVVVLHTGNFLPKYLNGSASGNNKDSSIVAICNSFAKRGYVVLAPNYRMGWDPLNAEPDIRRGTLLVAVYRALNDVKTVVRYAKKEAASLGIDANKVILYGNGSGGYLTLAYAGLDRIQELENEPTGKWISGITAGPFVENQLYIDTAVVGDVTGFGGTLNVNNHPGYSNDVIACINAGGALGDSAWMEADEVPVISFHSPTDPFAPFTNGLVIVPTTNEVVVDVVGSRWAVGKSNEIGNNDVLGGPYSDAYSTAAYAALASTDHPSLGLTATDYEGLFPFRRGVQVPSQPVGVYFPESSPWDWWDEATVVATAATLGADGQTIHNNGLLTNPDMSAAKGRAYIDSIMGYLAPRLNALLVSVGVDEQQNLVENSTSVYPNPAQDFFVVKTRDNIAINAIEIFAINGSLVASEFGINTLSRQIDIADLTSGLYVIKVTTEKGIVSRKLFKN
jgi:poly(3-hydroxybutyrate) depolymerase